MNHPLDRAQVARVREDRCPFCGGSISRFNKEDEPDGQAGQIECYCTVCWLKFRLEYADSEWTGCQITPTMWCAGRGDLEPTHVELHEGDQTAQIEFDLRGPVSVAASLTSGPDEDAIAVERIPNAIWEYLELQFPFPVRIGKPLLDAGTGSVTVYAEHADSADTDAAEFVLRFPVCNGPSFCDAVVVQGNEIHLQLFTATS